MKTEAKTPCTPEQVDEAAVWMTLLHSQDRNERTDRGFKRWLAANPANAVAFEKVSIAHELTGAIPLKPLPPPDLLRQDKEIAGWRRGLPPARTHLFRNLVMATAAAVLVTLGGLYLHTRASGIATAVGEQRTVTLADGSQVTLNTDTQIIERFDERLRRIELKNGEALFEVAREPGRPFVVTAGGREITALGTTFNIRRDTDKLAVTLIDGKVAVSAGAPVAVSPAASTSTPDKSGTILTPGQRITFRLAAQTVAAEQGSADVKPISIDRPELNKVTAWRTGRVEFDKVPLSEAIVEINRYNHTKLSYERPEAASIPITGVFRAGSARSFAAAVAESYGLQVRETGDSILLSGEPGASVQSDSAPAAR